VKRKNPFVGGGGKNPIRASSIFTGVASYVKFCRLLQSYTNFGIGPYMVAYTLNKKA